jgi:hypothetical protein
MLVIPTRINKLGCGFAALFSIAPLSFDLNLQALDGLFPPSIHFLPSDKSVAT